MNRDVLRMRHVTTINDALRLRHNSIETLTCTCVPRYQPISGLHLCSINMIHNPFLVCTHVPWYMYIYNHIYQVYIRQTIYISDLLFCASMLPDIHYLTWRIHTLPHESSTQERWGAGVETQKNARGEIGGWGRVPFNETYAPSLSTIYDGA